LDPFFVTKKVAAVHKHGILEAYLAPFASKVGSSSVRIIVSPCSMGTPAQAAMSGTEGSPALLAVTASTVKEFRTVECHLVEHKRSNFKLLKESSTERAQSFGRRLTARPTRSGCGRRKQRRGSA